MRGDQIDDGGDDLDRIKSKKACAAAAVTTMNDAVTRGVEVQKWRPRRRRERGVYQSEDYLTND